LARGLCVPQVGTAGWLTPSGRKKTQFDFGLRFCFEFAIGFDLETVLELELELVLKTQ
jgi:hypothetical protein